MNSTRLKDMGRTRGFSKRPWLVGLLGMPALFILMSACNAGKAKAEKADLFLRPAGPYAVGTHEYLWTDDTREEPFTKDPSDRRRLLARVWYPAEPAPGKERAPYIVNISEFPKTSINRKAKNVVTNAITDAPLAKTEGLLPVLLYEPGAGMSRFIATFLAEQLASRGYVVVSTDHPGLDDTVLFPDGHRFKADTMLAPDVNAFDPLLYRWLEDSAFPVWMADASFALDKIAELDETAGQLFSGRLDLSRIGMLGWSFGGALSVQMSKDDPRVKAAIDQDGQLFGDVWKTGTSRPVMLMHGIGEIKAPDPEVESHMKKKHLEIEAQNRSLLEHSTNDGYEVAIANAPHGHFSDCLLFLPDKLKPGELDPRRAHEIILAYTLAFFDKYLRGQDNGLLAAPSPDYPEVTFKKKN